MDSSESSTNPTPIPESQQPLLPNQQQQEVAAAVGTTSTVIGINKINPLDNLSQLELRKKLDSSRNELRKALDRKKRIDKDLATLENSIYAFEGSYLSDSLLPQTASAGNTNVQFGNIIRGYDSYLKAPPTGADRKRSRGTEGEPRDGERIFSRSSATHQKAVELRTAEIVDAGGGGGNGNGNGSASEEESLGGGSSGPGRKRRKNRD